MSAFLSMMREDDEEYERRTKAIEETDGFQYTKDRNIKEMEKQVMSRFVNIQRVTRTLQTLEDVPEVDDDDDDDDMDDDMDDVAGGLDHAGSSDKEPSQSARYMRLTDVCCASVALSMCTCSVCLDILERQCWGSKIETSSQRPLLDWRECTWASTLRSRCKTASDAPDRPSTWKWYSHARERATPSSTFAPSTQHLRATSCPGRCSRSKNKERNNAFT